MTGSMPENDVIIAKNVSGLAYPTAGYIAAADPPTDRKKKKKRSGFGIFNAALLMFRKRRGEKSGSKINLTPKQQDDAAANNLNPNWTKLVDSVRPLHVQEASQSPPPSPPAPADEVDDEIRETISPASPAGSSSSVSSSYRGMSKYASAASLLDLDNSSDEEEEDPDEVFDALTGDEMIDAKAEEFIAQFYKQMDLQRAAKTRHHHHHQHNLSRGI